MQPATDQQRKRPEVFKSHTRRLGPSSHHQQGNKMAEVEGEYFDSDKACSRISTMWLALGDKIAAAALNFEEGDAAEAVRFACCAEACFWKATGEADTHDVKDVLPRSPQDTSGDVGKAQVT